MQVLCFIVFLIASIGRLHVRIVGRRFAAAAAAAAAAAVQSVDVRWWRRVSRQEAQNERHEKASNLVEEKKGKICITNKPFFFS